ncbi:hypothetical protein RM717_13430 [Streptomyces griseus]|uniref:Uncharacterized protein n=3 Tax=Streptomyces TaxID=1883 RepID=A0ABU2W0X0_9ACTN|nr:hypothetical protein [Streptomyces griseus]MDT0491508.1 hypothetical protein [Streptomyces griseus]
MIRPGGGEPEDEARLRRYLLALVQRRAAPVHVAVAFNAVYFGFDTQTAGYAGGPLDIGDFPSVALGDDMAALPVGAMINVRTGGDLLPAEIVYKEGAHEALGLEGDLPGWLSGAPAGAQGPDWVDGAKAVSLRERLVFDADAFGPGLAASDTRLQRLRRRGIIDAHGSLVVNSVYDRSGDGLPESDLDDTSYYLRYLMTRGRDQLDSSLAPMPLPLMLPPGATQQDKEAGLRNLVNVVRRALLSLPEIRLWGEYAFTRASMADLLDDGGPLGRDALETLARSVARGAAPTASRRTAVRRRPVYTALGPALCSMPGAAALMRGTVYPSVVLHANAVLMDYVQGEADEKTGLLPTGVRVALDDRWQGGGVWRAEHSGGDAASEVPRGLSEEPAGQGWAECRELRARAAAVVAPEPGAAYPVMLWSDEPDLGEPVQVDDAPDRREWQQPLRARQLEGGYLPMPPAVTTGQGSAGLEGRAPHGGSLLRPGPDVIFRLEHHGHPSSVQRVRMDEEGRLVGLRWPSTCFPGILLDLVWRRGSRTVEARTAALLPQRTVDGESIEHRYDQRVHTRDTAWRQPSDDTPGGRTRWLVMSAVRRFGLLDVIGRAMLARELLAPALPLVMPDAPESPTADRVGAAVVELLDIGALTRVHGSWGDGGRPCYPARLGEKVVELLCYTPRVVEGRPRGHGEAEDGTSPVRSKAVHHVPGFLRYIGHLGYEASPEQRRLFRQDFLKFGLVGSPELPLGYTYVRPHQRGS